MSVFHYPVRIYYEDTDAGGVVYYANYLKFFERCRTEWLRSLGHEQVDLLATHDIAFVVKSVAVDYKRPARLDDSEIASWLTAHPNWSLADDHLVLDHPVRYDVGCALATASVRWPKRLIITHF